MPHVKHPSLTLPDNLDAKIWRYMDFPRFISLLEEKALYFTSIRNFQDDPYEGSVTKVTAEKMKVVPIGERNLRAINGMRRNIYASCWHLNEFESAAMWRQYAGPGRGIAIQSTVQQLINALANTEIEIHLGKVNYDVDYYSEEIPEMNSIVFAAHKRSHFKSDDELRALILDPKIQEGQSIKVDLEQLIERIYTSPNTPIWVNEVLSKMLIRYGINKKLIPSEI